ncbi:hypothetical protein GHT06_011259 [Daphnia sinensis]|uniref:Uncharacterized protein n=1 Tax=Daphnia sinensis TaxID=1820382 RepID=A0AAD5KZN6_9CRUS|nr:hypothetical protein GHT06_011259 [Daphnia sinensis]
MASIHARAPSVLQKIVTKPDKSLKGKPIAPILSLSARMALIEKRLSELEQDNLWWSEWKKDEQIKFGEQERQLQNENEPENIENDLA